MPSKGAHRSPISGVMEAAENHRNSMYEHLLALIHQHLATPIIVPPGHKTRKTDSDSVGKYAGGERYSDLKNWLADLMVMFKTELYGGPGHEREHVMHILSFLTGEAKKWYHHHILSINRRQLIWSFKDVILGLYNWFVHSLMMQDACTAFFMAQYGEEKGV